MIFYQPFNLSFCQMLSLYMYIHISPSPYVPFIVQKKGSLLEGDHRPVIKPMFFVPYVVHQQVEW